MPTGWCSPPATRRPVASVGAEALSGLARAFFFAGARTLLVSHWAVNSAATAGLTTQTFGGLAADPELGRSEAFRAHHARA